MRTQESIFLAIILRVVTCCALSFTTPRHRRSVVSRGSSSSQLGNNRLHRATFNPPRITMRDASSAYWFNVGDAVVVVDDVKKAGTSLKGLRGTVVETWEKCDVDPTCCCAEQVDLGTAVRVEFPGTETNPSESGSSFMHYFAEDELTRVKEEELPFDGMSCKAFKLDQLKMGEQAKRIAAYEQSRQTYEARE